MVFQCSSLALPGDLPDVGVGAVQGLALRPYDSRVFIFFLSSFTVHGCATVCITVTPAVAQRRITVLDFVFDTCAPTHESQLYGFAADGQGVVSVGELAGFFLPPLTATEEEAGLDQARYGPGDRRPIHVQDLCDPHHSRARPSGLEVPVHCEGAPHPHVRVLQLRPVEQYLRRNWSVAKRNVLDGESAHLPSPNPTILDRPCPLHTGQRLATSVMPTRRPTGCRLPRPLQAKHSPPRPTQSILLPPGMDRPLTGISRNTPQRAYAL